MVGSVEAKNLGKKFARGHDRPLLFKDLFAAPFLRRRSNRFWALRGVNFEVKKGESLGVIGQNGAGKTTLLRILCGVTNPTEGTVDIRGRVSSLLEPGAGFHHLLTGRENIILSGAILGMCKKEIKSKIGEIARFAEMEDFLDVPVRAYSSGMFMRLGFSIAVHADPDVLLVDEALAVGDLKFQRKCVDRIKSLRSEGKTVIIVSHNISHIRQACETALWLKDGSVEQIGPREKVIGEYLDHLHTLEDEELKTLNRSGRCPAGADRIMVEDARLFNGADVETNVFHVGQPLVLRLKYYSPEKIERPVFGLIFHDELGDYLVGINSLSRRSIDFVRGRGEITYEVASLNLLPGTYYISTSVHNEDGDLIYHYRDRALKLSVYHDPSLLNAERIYSGHFQMPCRWSIEGAGWSAEESGAEGAEEKEG